MTNPAANRMISILYRYSQRILSYALRKTGCELEIGQLPTLMQVYRNPGTTQEGISANAGIDKGTTARCVGQLEENGYIYRQIDQNDRRVNHIHPTEKALLLFPTVQQILKDYHTLLYKGLTEEEIVQAVTLLGKMKENVADFIQERMN